MLERRVREARRESPVCEWNVRMTSFRLYWDAIRLDLLPAHQRLV